MEKRQQQQTLARQQGRCHNRLSFSASLLDAAYRSVDESDGTSLYQKSFSCNLKGAPHSAASQHAGYHSAGDFGFRRKTTNSSSSDGSTLRDFSSSDTDSTHRRLHPSLSVAQPPPPQTITRACNLRKTRGGTRSPRVLLAAFLCSIFSVAKGSTKKSKAARVSSAGSSSQLGRQKRTKKTSEPPTMGSTKLEEAKSNWESDSSSDLFELDNLSPIQCFTGELPVYGTTNLENNNAF